MKRVNDINSWNLFQFGLGTGNFENTFNWTITDNMPYVKCSKISNTFLYLFSNKMLVIRAGIHKMHA